MINLGEYLCKLQITQTICKKFLTNDPKMYQTLHGIKFQNPIGLATGFDYEARIPKLLPSLGFGFGTVGTITNKPYEGNIKPRLGRLIKSLSLIVNKGFKNRGIDELIERHTNSQFEIPIGLSIGKTNQKDQMTQEEAVQDIVSTFIKAESARLPFSYYELNISCPNLYGDIEFHSPVKLQQLLKALGECNISKPIFVKMPINNTNEEILAILNTISSFPIAGVIFGNLQKDRNHPLVDQRVLEKYPKGYLSGKPTWERSNELISLAYKNFGKKLTIIGCGGVFNTKDAYHKIKLGASLVQIATGLIYEGPTIILQITNELPKLLEKDGFKNISEAVGTLN
jgi:dihydroorotate dehydrogenase subfamily 2